MQTVGELLDAIRERRNLSTDSALATALGVSRQTVNNWRQGRNTPDAVACATIAGLTGEPLALVLGIAGEQRAVSREEKAVWRKLAATAASLIFAIGICGHAGKAYAVSVSAAPFSIGAGASSIHYAKCYLAGPQGMAGTEIAALSDAEKMPCLQPTNAFFPTNNRPRFGGRPTTCCATGNRRPRLFTVENMGRSRQKIYAIDAHVFEQL